MKVKCNHCKEDTAMRVVIKRYPLEKLVLPNEYDEFYCTNIIKFRKKNRNNWIEEECRNRVLIKKEYLKDKILKRRE